MAGIADDGEQLAETFFRCFGLPVVGLRYFNVVGSRQSPDGPYAAVVPRFFAAASNTMRRVLVDHARRRHRLKRGAGGEQVSLEEAEESLFLSESEADELVALDDALERLGRVSARGVEVIQHRFFGGLSVEETAQLLGVSTKTVQREWVSARAWLRKEIARDLGFMR